MPVKTWMNAYQGFYAGGEVWLEGRSFWRITDLHFAPDRTTWRVLREGQPWGEFEFAMAGEYNVVNATAAAAMARITELSRRVIAEALSSFKSVKRRLEIKAQVDGITIIDDFAHHPTAIAATLTALRVRYPESRLWAIFEPRSNTLRRKVLQNDLVASLALADQIIITPIFKPEAVPENERLTTAAVVKRRDESRKACPRNGRCGRHCAGGGSGTAKR